MTRDKVVLTLILLLIGLAFLANYMVTDALLPAALYGVILLIAAFFLPPHFAAAVAVLVVGSYLLLAWVQQLPLLTTAMREAGLAATGYLATMFSARIEREAALKVEAEGLAEERKHTIRTLRTLIDTMPAGVMVADAAGRVLMANPAINDMLGDVVTEGNIHGPGPDRRLHRPNGTPYLHSELPLVRALEKGEIIRNMEILVRRDDGTEKVLAVSGAPVRNALGNVAGAVAVFQDITLRWLADAMLQAELETRKELEIIVHRSPAVAFLRRATEGWPVEFVSENVIQFGYTPEDLISGRVPYIEIIHPEDQEKVAAEVSRFTREGQTEFTQEYRIVTRLGETRWVDDRTWVRRDANGRVTHYQGIVLDVTKRKGTEAEGERLLAAQQELLRAVSNDLRVPLSAVRDQAQLLLQDLARTELNGRAREHAEAIIAGSRQINDMIQELVDSARLKTKTNKDRQDVQDKHLK